MERSEEILRYWFGPIEGEGWLAAPGREEIWFRGGDEVDETLRLRFGPDVEVALAGGYADWTSTPRGRLARILLLDQFTRNIHRGKPDAFAGDPIALPMALEALASGEDRALRPIERVFLYLPLEHAEDPAIQRRCVDAYRALAQAAPPDSGSTYDGFVDYATRHQVIVDRFGRFPHRNRILGRASTPEEEAFLLEPGSSF